MEGSVTQTPRPTPWVSESAGLGWSPGICHFNQLAGDDAASGLGSNFRVSTQVTHENHQESLKKKKKKKKSSGPSPDQLHQNLWCFLSCVLLLFYKALGKTLIYSQGLRPTELQDVYSIRTVLRGRAPAVLCSGRLRMTQGVPRQPTHQHTPPPRATCWDSCQDTPDVIVVTKSCPTLCNPMDCSTPDLPVFHYLPESAQTHVHWVSDAIQPSHPLALPAPPAFNLSQVQGFFQWVGSSYQMTKGLEPQLQHQSFQWIVRVDLLQDSLVWSPCSPRDSQESSPAAQFKSINSLALSLLYGPTLTSVHDYWTNHSFDYTDLCQQSRQYAV